MLRRRERWTYKMGMYFVQHEYRVQHTLMLVLTPFPQLTDNSSWSWHEPSECAYFHHDISYATRDMLTDYRLTSATQFHTLSRRWPRRLLPSYHDLVVVPWARPKQPTQNHANYASLPHSTFLLALSSLASLRLCPHFCLISSCSRATLSAFSGFLAIKPTKNWLQPNFSASLTRVHVSGSSLLSRRISATSASLRWYVFSYGWRTGGGRAAVGRGGRWLCVWRGVPGAATGDVCRA